LDIFSSSFFSSPPVCRAGTSGPEHLDPEIITSHYTSRHEEEKEEKKDLNLAIDRYGEATPAAAVTRRSRLQRPGSPEERGGGPRLQEVHRGRNKKKLD